MFFCFRYKSGKMLWRCSVRDKNTKCPATVSQDGDTFTPGSQPHNHICLLGADSAAIIRDRAFIVAADKKFTAASAIVTDEIKAQFPTGELPPGAPKPENIIRNVNRHRQALLPTDPLATDLGFDTDPEYKSDAYILADIYVHK